MPTKTTHPKASAKARKATRGEAGGQKRKKRPKSRAPFQYEPLPFYSEEFKAETVTQALVHIEEGLSLMSFCEARGLRFGSVWRWIDESAPDKSLRARSVAIGTHALAHKVQRVIEDATPETATLVKAQVDGFLRLAGLWNKIDYGESKHIDITARTMPDWSRLSEAARAEVRALLAEEIRQAGHDLPPAPMGLPAPSTGSD